MQPPTRDEVRRIEEALRAGPPTPADLARWAEVLYLRYWRYWWLWEIAERLGVTRQRAYQIERAALARLRHPVCREAALALAPEGSALRAALFPGGE
jgi:hypothetical protein